MRIKKLVAAVVGRHGSRDPFFICERLNIEIIYYHFSENIKGFFVKDNLKKQFIIALNSHLLPRTRKAVLSHELGHAYLHPELSRYYIKRNTLFSTDKFEREADIFAAELLVPDLELIKHLKERSTLLKMSYELDVPLELLRIKIGNGRFDGEYYV